MTKLPIKSDVPVSLTQDLVNRTHSEFKQAGIPEHRLRWLRAASDALDAARMDLPFDAVKVFAS